MEQEQEFSINDFKSQEVDDRNVLEKGRHDLIIHSIYKINDRQSFEGVEKTQEQLDAQNIDWKDKKPVLGGTFTKEGGGVISERFYFFGFKRFDKLIDNTGFWQSAYEEPYAINETTGERVIDIDKTATAQNMLNQLFKHCHRVTDDGEFERLPIGSKPDDLVGCHVSGEVIPKEYNGKTTNANLTNFRDSTYIDSDVIIDNVDETVEKKPAVETKKDKKARKKAEKKALLEKQLAELNEPEPARKNF